MDSITATIEAVLASASALAPSYQKIKKAKRLKKEEQDGNVPKDQKAEDAEENDDGSGNNTGLFFVCVFCFNLMVITANSVHLHRTGDTNRRRVATEEQVQFALLHG